MSFTKIANAVKKFISANGNPPTAEQLKEILGGNFKSEDIQKHLEKISSVLQAGRVKRNAGVVHRKGKTPKEIDEEVFAMRGTGKNTATSQAKAAEKEATPPQKKS